MPLPEPGDLIAAKYRIERALSEGGMGAVYVARHTATQRAFALKLMRPELSGDAEAEARFVREARLAGAIDHPVIIEVYDIGRHGEFPYMVMKLLEGESLGERMKRGPIEPDKALSILLPVLDGVAAAHERGVVHRDLKPDNIFLCATDDGVAPKILDFGISKLVGADAYTQGLTATGVVLGTPLYMSPEQVRGARDVDARTDIYALGVILYEMLAGARPYQATNYADLVLQIITGNPPGVRERNAAVSPALDSVVRRAMAVDREARYPDVRSFARELQAAQRDELRVSSRITAASRPSTTTPFAPEGDLPVPAPPRSRRGVFAATGMLILAGLGTWAVIGTGSDAPPAPPVHVAAPAAVVVEEEPATPEANEAEVEAEAREQANVDVDVDEHEHEHVNDNENAPEAAALEDTEAQRKRERLARDAKHQPPAQPAPPVREAPAREAPAREPGPSFQLNDDGLIDPFADP